MSDVFVWRTFRGAVSIERCAATRISAQSVWRMHSGKERREARVTEWTQYHDTYQQARDFLVRRHTALVRYAEAALARERGVLATAHALPETPEELR